MTSKSVAFLQLVHREDLGTRLSCFGCENKMADISFVLRVRTRRNNCLKKHGKNSKKTTRRATSTIWRIFTELNNPNVHYAYGRWIDGGKNVLAMFLN